MWMQLHSLGEINTAIDAGRRVQYTYYQEDAIDALIAGSGWVSVVERQDSFTQGKWRTWWDVGEDPAPKLEPKPEETPKHYGDW